MKKNSLKTTGIVVASLAAVALVSVGFSAWVIQALTPTEAKSVTLSVADTTDNSIALAVAADPAPDLVVKFDAATDDTAGDITASSTGVDMVFGFTFTITVGSSTTVPGQVAHITAAFTPDAGLATAVSANYVVSPLPTSGSNLALPATLAAGTYYDGSTTVKTDFKEKYVIVATSTTVYTVTASFQFAWGEYFGGVNPSLCDSAMTPSAYNSHTLADITAALGSLKTDLNGKTIASLVLTPVSK